ncbi:uncharacterized protein LOC124119805 [Haliotis rufescens]|uniref:uncharacterized protein LOC124119805 n=1 Tax=Haliotis rufescens TaxID=6454 RepID=UPI00201F6D4E|nr:uncharacterized protein LOC124119805 [Haliotis rufescens]
MQAIVLKLPQYLQTKWRDRVTQARIRNHVIGFPDLVVFIDFAAKSANEPTFSKQALTNLQDASYYKGTHNKAKQMSHMNQSTSLATQVGNDTSQCKRISSTCYFCKQPHDLDDCRSFAQKSLSVKRDFLKESNRCFSCYGLNHSAKGCLKRRTCKTCSRRHPTAMHDNNFQPLKRPNEVVSESSNKQCSNDTPVKQVHDAASCNASKSNNCIETVLQPILPVNVKQKGSNRVITTYAMLDNGSTGCFITEDLRDRLGAKCSPTVLKLQTMNSVDFVKTSAVDDLVVSDLDDMQQVDLPRTFSKDVMPADHDHFPKPELLKQFSHLKTVSDKLPVHMPNLDIGLLIGSNCSLALQPLEVVPPLGEGPFAVLYRHGWTMNGPIQLKLNLSKNTLVCNRIVQKVKRMHCS